SLTFWTACPYCYVLYEYPKVYEDCTLRCQAENCRRAFHAVVIPSPPPVDGKETYLCTMGFFPLGFSGNGENMGGNFPRWSPVSTMFACPNNKNAGKQTSAQKSAPRVFYDEDDIYIEISSAEDTNNYDDDDNDKWQKERRKKKAKGEGSVVRNAKTQRSERVNGNGRGVSMVPEAEPSKRGVTNSGYVEGLEEFLSSLHMLAVGGGR
ncbi:hypothetical protein Golob_007157, partial [Gossypium lobatum]|nr:hypothetical protein [Gossypium lobatum]